jgi:chromosome segregation ATPase
VKAEAKHAAGTAAGTVKGKAPSAEKAPELTPKAATAVDSPEPVAMEAAVAEAVPDRKNDNVARAVETIKDLSSDFTMMVFEKKAIQQKLEMSASSMVEVARENALLKENLSAFEKNRIDNSLLEKEIVFLNEQLEDADHYIQNMVGLLEERMLSFEQEAAGRRELEGRFEKISREIQEKAKMDVKISILERDISISSTRILELESKLQEEYQRREPLEQEIVELKDALDRVYSSLSHIRLKAKREVYGS